MRHHPRHLVPDGVRLIIKHLALDFSGQAAKPEDFHVVLSKGISALVPTRKTASRKKYPGFTLAGSGNALAMMPSPLYV